MTGKSFDGWEPRPTPTNKKLNRDLVVGRSEEFLDKVIENIPNMVFVKEAKDLRFVRFNKAGEKLLGFTKADLLGKNDYDFFSERASRALSS